MLTAERLKEILILYIENDYNELDGETIYETLINWCDCTDEELKTLGLEYLIPPSEDELRTKIYDIYNDIVHNGLSEDDWERCRYISNNLVEIIKASDVKLLGTVLNRNTISAYAEFCKFYNEPSNHLDVEKIKRLLGEILVG